MKILVFTYGSMVGGANRSLLMVLLGLKNTYGHEIHVIGPAEGTLREEFEKSGISYNIEHSHTMSGVTSFSPINIFRLIRYSVHCFLDQRTAKRIAHNIANDGYDMVYINDTDNYLGALVANEAGLPYVWHFRSLVPSGMHFIMGADKLYKRCSQIITISESMKEQLEKNNAMPQERITMIHNGIPYDKSAPQSSLSTENGFHIVQCGRINPSKGHLDAIRAIAILRDRGYKDIHLHIVGATPNNEETDYLASIKKEISLCNIEDAITFEGLINDMPEFRKNMVCELVCSICEPFGRVTVEGMRSGLVVIGSNTGGTPEIINDGVTGLLYEQGSHIDLANKIELVYNDTEKREKLAKQALFFSRTHFTAEKNIEAINSVILRAKEEFEKENGIG